MFIVFYFAFDVCRFVCLSCLLCCQFCFVAGVVGREFYNIYCVLFVISLLFEEKKTSILPTFYSTAVYAYNFNKHSVIIY